MLAILVPDEADEDLGHQLRRLRDTFCNRAYVALTLRRRPNDHLRLDDIATPAATARVPTVVTNDVLFHEPDRRILQDVVTCIRHNVTIDNAGFRRERHADRYLKPPEEMHRLFARYPEALARTVEIAAREMLVRIRVKIENEIRGLLRTFGVLFGKRVGGFTGRADEIIAGELDASSEMRLIAEPLMKARASVLDQIKVLYRRLMAVAKNTPHGSPVHDRAERRRHHRPFRRLDLRRRIALPTIVECWRLPRSDTATIQVRRDEPQRAHL